MKVMKRCAAVLIVVALMFSAFGCKSSETQTGELDEGYVPDVSGKVTITYQLATTEIAKKSVTQYVTAFEKQYPNVKVTTDFSKGDTALRISSGDIGDVFFLWETDVYNYASVNQALMPLDSYVEAFDIDLSNVYSSVLDFGRVDGQLYMIARDYNHLVMQYNKDAVVAEGLTDPVELEAQDAWTWDTFKDYCAALTKSDGGFYTQVGASLRCAYAPVYIPFLEGWGGTWYDNVNKKITLYSDEKVLDGVNEMLAAIDTGTVYCEDHAGLNIYQGEKATPYSKLVANDVAQFVFQDVEFPMLETVGYAYDSYDIDWNIVSMPKFPTHKVGAGATGFAVYNKTNNPDAAAALCLFLMSEDGQTAYNGAEGGSVPNVKALADSDFWKVPFDPEVINYDAFTSYPEADTRGLIELCVPPDIAKIVSEGLENLAKNHINGIKSAEDTLKEVEEQANQLWTTLS